MRGLINKTFRHAILDRDDHTCQYCGVAITGAFAVDHIIPCCWGGDSLLHNLTTACVKCNERKHMETWIPRNLDAICAYRPEHAARVRQLAAPRPQIVATPRQPKPAPTPNKHSAAKSARMQELWADPAWRGPRMARMAAEKAARIAQWEAYYGRPYKRARKQK